MHSDDDSMFREIGRELRRQRWQDASVDERVMSEIRQLPRYRRLGLWSRINRPRTVRVSPLVWGGIAAAALFVAGMGGARLSAGSRAQPVTPGGGRVEVGKAEAVDVLHRIQFMLVAPEAKKVSVVGDFNGWDASHAAYQAEHRGGGVWIVTAPVPFGHHRYSFVVDDSLWVADPNAPRVIDGDFGFPNSAIVVGEGT